jgi:hypothetical protein
MSSRRGPRLPVPSIALIKAGGYLSTSYNFTQNSRAEDPEGRIHSCPHNLEEELMS